MTMVDQPEPEDVPPNLAEQAESVLVETGRVFAESLDYEMALRNVANLLAPTLADWCLVELVQRDRLELVAAAHRIPEKNQLAWKLRRRCPLQPNERAGAPRVIRTGEPELYSEMSDDLLGQIAEDEQHLRVLRGLRPCSSIIVPLVVRGERLGALTLVSERSNRYGPADLPLIEELGRRCGLAVDHARLYQSSRASERRYRALFESIDERFCIVEMIFCSEQKPVDYRFIEANPAFEGQTGLTDAMGKTAREVVPDLEEKWIAVYGRVALTGEGLRFTQASEAMGRWFDVYAFRVGDPRESKVAFLFSDITHRKQAEEERERLLSEVQTERERLADIFQYAPSFMCVLRGPEHVFERANSLYLQLVGNRDLVGKTVREAFPEVEGQGFFELLDRVYKTGEPYQAEGFSLSLHQEPAGSEERWIDFVYQPLRDADGSITGVFVQGVDRTERKKTEEALRESEARVRIALEAADLGVWELDLTGPAPQATSRSLKHDLIFGYTEPPPEWSYRSFLEHVLEEDRDYVDSNFQRALANQEDWSFECRIRRTDGAIRWIWARGSLILDSQGRPRRMRGLVGDITGRKQAEHALRESEQRFHTMADSAPVLIWMSDSTGAFTWCNKQWLDFTGRTIEQEKGNGWTDNVNADDKSQCLAVYADSVRTREPFQMEYRLRRYDGAYRWIIDDGVPRFTPDGTFIGFIGSCTDITGRREAEHQLQQLNETLEQRVTERTAIAERRAAQLQAMAAELTRAEERERRRLAEVLHDHLQQLLAASQMQIDVLSRRAQSPAVELDFTNVANLLAQSLDTSRSLTVELSPPILYDSGLVAALQWLSHWMREKHELNVHLEVEDEIEPDDEDLRILLFKAVRELLFNTAKYAGVHEVHVQVRQGNEARLEVTVVDEGSGFDPEKANQQKGSGGFGLFSIRERLELMGGRLSVWSRPGKGTRVMLQVPMSH